MSHDEHRCGITDASYSSSGLACSGAATITTITTTTSTTTTTTSNLPMLTAQLLVMLMTSFAFRHH